MNANKTQLKMRVISGKKSKTENLIKSLRNAIAGIIEAEVTSAEGPQSIEADDIVLVDEQTEELDSLLEQIKQVRSSSRAIVYLLVQEEQVLGQGVGKSEQPNEVPKGNEARLELLKQELVQDFLVWPLRPLEILSKLRAAEYLKFMVHMKGVNANFQDLIDFFTADLNLVEKLHSKRAPKRFSKIKDFRIAHRYLAGIKPGGDHFDIAESKNRQVLSLFYQNCSSYGFSEQALSTFMKILGEFSENRLEEENTVVEVMRRFAQEVVQALGEKHEISALFGIYSRKSQTFWSVNLGHARMYLLSKDAPVKPIPFIANSQLKKSSKLDQIEVQVQTLKLLPGDRLVLLSKGFTDIFDSQERLSALLDRMRGDTGERLLNEFALLIYSLFQMDAELPPQDCTGVVLDQEGSVLQLARPGEDSES